jgi:hypothetical protein
VRLLARLQGRAGGKAQCQGGRSELGRHRDELDELEVVNRPGDLHQELSVGGAEVEDEERAACRDAGWARSFHGRWARGV